LIDSGRKGFLRSFFSEIEIADQPNQRGDNPAPIGPINCFNGLGGI
jgi:hypothetical protein